MGLIGVGIATFVANFLYWLLSVIIVLPDLNLSFPKNTVLKMLITSIPIGCILFLFKKFEVVPAAYQMIVLLLTFYLTYYAVGKKVIKNSD
jgi:hypothetical protein